MSSPVSPLPPGSVIGMLGGGQLGRMTALAAARLGYRTHVLCPDPDSPCAQVTDRSTLSSYTDHAALDAFAAQVDVVTYEFENIPYETVLHLAARVPVRPGPDGLAVCQDRVAEKDFCQPPRHRHRALAGRRLGRGAGRGGGRDRHAVGAEDPARGL